MKTNLMALLAFALVAIIGCTKESEKMACQETGFTSDLVCSVSFFQLLGSAQYLGHVVRVKGYLHTETEGGLRRRVLFFSKEQRDISNMEAAIEIGAFHEGVKPSRVAAYEKSLQAEEGSYIELIGTFERSVDAGWQWPSYKIAGLVGVTPVFDKTASQR